MCGNFFGGNNSCMWIILILILISCCGCGGGCGTGCGGNTCGTSCGNNCYCETNSCGCC